MDFALFDSLKEKGDRNAAVRPEVVRRTPADNRCYAYKVPSNMDQVSSTVVAEPIKLSDIRSAGPNAGSQ